MQNIVASNPLPIAVKKPFPELPVVGINENVMSPDWKIPK